MTSPTTTRKTVDVIIVGYGPTGLVLASLLGQKGHQVAVVERWPALYGKPRLSHIDGETARLISLAGDGEEALRESWTTPHYYWKNGKGQLLMDVAHGNTRRMLWDDHISVHLPHIEEEIHKRIAALPNVHLYRGYQAADLVQDADGVRLTGRTWGDARHGGDVDELHLQARYLVGADGAKSHVRESIGVERIDFGFNERWLCVDTEPLRPLPAKFNENGMQICDPKRGYMFIPIGKKRQRFEFALLPGESTESMQTVDAAFRLLQDYHGIGREDVSLIRNLVYTFECRLAQRWRVGRVFLAGDAAHTNPPYLGQGACSGMRDGANLAWKLDLVLRGVADDGLLDTYEAERRPHCQTLMLDARSLGQVANTSNPLKAAVRDLLFRFKLTPKPKFPILTAGVLAHGDDGKPVSEAGTLPAQGHLMADGKTLRFDDHVGFRFALIARAGALAGLSASSLEELALIGVRLIELAPDSGPGVPMEGVARMTDLDGVYGRLLDPLHADVVIIRPDFVLFGHAAKADAAALVEQLLQRLHHAPSRLPGRQMAAA